MDKRVCFSGRKRASETECKKENFHEKTDKKADLAANFVMVAGCFALVLFFLLGAFGRNAKQVSYSNYANDEHEGAISVFSQIIYPDGRIEKSTANSYEIRNNATQSSANSANAKDTFADNSEPWNFWQYLCDSLAEIFGVTNAE